MKIKFERMYGEHKIGDIVEFEKSEELSYILATKTALVIEDDDFGNTEIENNKSEETEAIETEETEGNLEETNEIGKNGKNKKK
ncbi:hypothetical protein RO03_05760 [Fusobacterium nucleatum subsp. nucleatum]|uniref:Uncharacterized protein n=1 Tax=Fusobacterium nucleatum subsp. nucleatum TaxID=76856 RepID=A0A0X3Y1X3_FUSNC|nr:hypothetical protein [Fusobacterium nucleatum]KUL99033.1 hypothetical protein RO03_05760 [Fusobacterium nucleatum subsp. nucleatum]